MDRATFKLVMAIGVLLNSALYLSAVLAVALLTSHGLAWRFDIAAIGMTYLSYVAHFAADHDCADRLAQIAHLLVYLSIMLGVVAGLLLLL